jgi:hypothetical protein
MARLRPDALLDVTLDAFAGRALGAGADWEAFLGALRRRDRGSWGMVPEARDVVAHFKDAFGYGAMSAPPAQLSRFDGDPRAEGFRWDNRFNWAEDRLPGDGATAVDLDGHDVTYGNETLRIGRLSLGHGGTLRIGGGLVELRGADGLEVGAPGGTIAVTRAGQFLFDGYAQAAPLHLVIDGGRAVNRGAIAGPVRVAVSGGQFVLGDGDATFRLHAGSSLAVIGTEGRVGHDAPSGATRLVLAGGTLRFVFGPDGIAPIGAWRSGRHGLRPPADGLGIAVEAGRLAIDLSDLTPPVRRRDFRLLDGAAIEGDPGNLAVEIAGTPAGMTAQLLWDRGAGDLTLRLSPTRR